MATCLQRFWGLFLSLSLYFTHSTPTPHVYIVYLGHIKFHDPVLTSKHHHQLLSSVFASGEDAQRSMLYSYKHSFSGFSAKLNSTQAAALAKMEGVISVFRSKNLQLHTTRSWDFLGLTLDKSVVNPVQLALGDGIIVGILDSGIWPESKSFKEEPGMKPIPPTWRGTCERGKRFEPETACNRKLIGARYYVKGFEAENGPLNTSGNPEYRSPRDHYGHGTHTASTAVGSVVKDVSFFGLGKGTARGGAPRARLAVYKVCWDKGGYPQCNEADIMAAFEGSLLDGVHIISASFGVVPPLKPFFRSCEGIGSFHAMQLGVTVVFSAGNSGPDPSLIGNVQPWSIAVAASSVDRTFPTEILVNDSLSIMAESLFSGEFKGKLASPFSYFDTEICKVENRNKEFAKGKVVVLCFPFEGRVSLQDAVEAVTNASASGLIFVEPMTRQVATVDLLPVFHVNFEQGTKIKDYLFNSYLLPILQIKPTKTTIGKSPAPVVADFSSRGPSSITPDFLKPDVTAPGVNVLAAWPTETPPTPIPGDKRSVKWNFLSGTSMSCPHVTGIVALIKSVHPRWSPAEIRSALVTTAYTKDSTFDSILAGGSMEVAGPFDIGAGHVNPLRALDPGLVYDTKMRDYILILCNLGYSQENITRIVGPCPLDTRCPRVLPRNSDINYPSITVSNLESPMTIKRTVRNVGHNRNAVYFSTIVKPPGVEVYVWPRILCFSWFKEENSYYVTLKPKKRSQGRYDFGEIVWSDGFHHVRSPLVVFVNNTGGFGDSSI